MRITTVDPIPGNDVKDVGNAVFVFEGKGDDALRIYFESAENQATYEAIEPKHPKT